MKSIKALVVGLAVVVAGLTAGVAAVQAQTTPTAQEVTYAYDCKPEDPLCVAVYFDAPTQQLAALNPAYQSMAVATSGVRQVAYSVESRGNITASMTEFKKIANETLNDNRGWSRLGVTFNEVTSGGDFTLVLSEASQMTSFSANGCDTTYSCNVGRFVVINQDRWLGATPSWNQAGGSLVDYRHMVINHETGHWLGHGHANCPAAGSPAPVMQQQSINLQGCTFNPWPLASELHASRLGL